MNGKTFYYTVKDVSELLGVSESFAYKVIRELNVVLKENGYIAISGRIPKAFFNERFYLDSKNIK